MRTPAGGAGPLRPHLPAARRRAPVRASAWRWLLGWLLAALTLCCALGALAHEFKLDAVVNAFVKTEPRQVELIVRAPLYLFKSVRFPVAGVEIDVDNSASAVERALGALQRDIVLSENGRPMVSTRAAGRLSLPSDRSFENYEQAARHVGTPIEPGTHIVIDQGYVDARIVYPTSSANPEISIKTTAAPELGDVLKVALRYLPADGESRAMVVTRSAGDVALNPGWMRAAAGFTRLGITHILTGYDHLLFLLCLLVPLRGWRQILSVVTVFTIAHSFTLLGSAFDLAPSGVWFPPFVETAIAASIVYMALENIVGVDLDRRLLITGLFGLVHGFGFSYGMSENFQFAGTHLLVSLLAFNVGIELGQILALAVLLPVLALLRRTWLQGRIGLIVVSVLVAHTGWHWVTERAEAVWRAPWPSPNGTDIAVVVLWLGFILVAAGGLSVLSKRLRVAGDAKVAPPARALVD